jgi:hypothetical protein
LVDANYREISGVTESQLLMSCGPCDDWDCGATYHDLADMEEKR